MKLNHVNLCTSDVIALTRTLVEHFGYRLVDSGIVHGSDDASRFAAVLGPDGSELVITQIAPTPDGSPAYPKGFHFGLMQESREEVLAKHRDLDAAGYAPGPISDGFEVWGATWTAFYCPLGDGLEVEVNYRTHSVLLDGE
ncbi:VOC family protein [Kineosporia babensis]|uniref:VOC family protein n=1 Tax=Kineosporia babensis TaxID=499548 RepID=A0A9X1NB42_9ACTN|nr:VOC family protein [Kineosporia babensis]MCD5311957.1 VOC family protein [Kineosporia babensis]